MALYDIHGNVIDSSGTADGSVGIANLSDELVNRVLVTDENTAIINLLNVSKASVGRVIGGTLNNTYTAYYSSDYIPVKAGYPYVAQSWDASGNTSYDVVALFDEDNNFIQNYSTSGNGTLRYAIFTPEVNGYVRYTYTYSETANPMVFVGLATTDNFVEYTGETLDGEYHYKIASKFKNMIQRDVEPSNIFGKTVYIIGDSNADNWANGEAKYLEKRYGCTVKGYGKYGATWGSSVGTSDTSDSSAIGQYNLMVSENPIDESTELFPEKCVFLFMMGTNTASAGIGTIDDSGVDTDLGAANYILKRIRYYGRANAIGVFLPWACNTEKRNGLIELCEKYKIPYFDIPAIICDDSPTLELASQNYITDGGNHLAEHGWKAFVRVAHPWIAHNI